MNGNVPPSIEIEAKPSQAPKQDTFVAFTDSVSRTIGSSITTFPSVTEHPFASVTVTE